MRKETKEAISRLVLREWEQELLYQASQTIPETDYLDDMVLIISELNLIGGGFDKLRALSMKQEAEELLKR